MSVVMTADMVMKAMLSAPLVPSVPAMESANKILTSALESHFPTPLVAISTVQDIIISWTTTTSSLLLRVSSTGHVLYEFENRKTKPFGIMSTTCCKTESGDVTNPSEGTFEPGCSVAIRQESLARTRAAAGGLIPVPERLEFSLRSRYSKSNQPSAQCRCKEPGKWHSPENLTAVADQSGGQRERV